MSLKRKFEAEVETIVSSFRPMKQLRVSTDQPPTSSVSEDVAMEDASTDSGSAITGSPSYPIFDLYPFPTMETNDITDGVNQTYNMITPDSRTSSNASEENKPIGLLQPKASFIHNVSNCNQIPRLRVACESGIGGQRTLWTQCDQCGAIEMIEL